jgi:hypothetical protein
VHFAAEATTSTVPVAGWIAEDERSVQALREGQLTKKLTGGDLVTSVEDLVRTLLAWWPAPLPAPTEPSLEGQTNPGPGVVGAPRMNVGGWLR